MTGDTLSPQMRRFRKLDARRQTDPPPAPAVRPPVRSSLRPGGGGTIQAGRPARAGERGSGERWKRGGDGLVPSSSFISSSSSHLLSRPVVARLVVSSVIRIVRRSALLVARRPAPSFRRRPVPRLVHRSVVSSFRRSARPSSVGSSPLPVPRHVGRGVLPFDGERAWQADEAGVVAEP